MKRSHPSLGWHWVFNLSRKSQQQFSRSSAPAGRPPTEEDLKRLVGFYAVVTVAEGSKFGREGGSGAIARIASQVANIEEAILQGIQFSDPGPALKAALDFANFTKLTGMASTEVFEKAASIAKTLGKEETAAHLIKSLAEIWFARSEYDTARVRFKEALSLYRKLAYVRGEANCILGIGEIARARSLAAQRCSSTL